MSSKNPIRCPKGSNLARGFTLVETLVVISIIIVLAVIVTSIVGQVRRAANSAVCVSKMSQIGSAILIYSQDNSGRLPTSPVYNMFHSRQGPWYNREDRRIQNHIGQYLGAPESMTWSTSADLMTYDASFAWPGMLSKAKKGAPSVLLNLSVNIAGTDGTSTKTSPWSGTKSGNVYIGRMLERIVEPGKEYAFIELDQENAKSTTSAPPSPVHGNYRNALFFDWHVGRVPVEP